MARDLKLQVVLEGLNRASKPFREVSRSAIGLGADLKATRTELKGLQAQQRDVSSFRALKGQTEQTGKALEAARQKVKDLRFAHAANTTEMRKNQAASRAAIREATALKAKHSQQQTELQGLRGKLNAAGISTRNLGQHERELRSKISATNQAMAQQEARLKRLTAQQQRLGKAKQQYESTQNLAGSMAGTGAAGLATGSGMLYAGSRMVAPQAAAQQQGGLLAAQSGESTARAGEYTQIIQGIRADGLNSDITAIGAALAAVNSTFKALGDVSDRELDRATRKALDLSAVMGGDVAEHVQTAGILMKNGLAANSDEAFDLITRGMQQVSTSMRGELPEILHEYSTHFRSLGFNGAESMSLLVSMADQGKFALDKTGDALKEFSIRGSDMSKASQEAYELVGLNAATMSSAIASGGADARQALQQTAKGLLAITDPATRANASIALFGTPIEDLAVDQIPAFLQAMTGTGSRLGQIEGAASQLGDTLRDNLGGDIQRLSGAWSDLGAQLYGHQNGPLRGITQSITKVIGSVKSWVAENPELASGLVKTAGGIALLMAGMGGLTLAMASILGPFAMVRYGLTLMTLKSGSFLGTLWSLGKTALPLVAKGVLLIGRALLMNPIGLAVTAIAGAAYLIYKNWDRVGPYFTGLWAEIKTGFSSGLGGIATTLVNFSPLGLFYRAFAGVMGYLGVELPGKFTEFGGMIMQGLVNGIKNAAGAVKGAVVGAADSSINYFKEKLGIHSPSRVFAELGGDTMAGLTQGLEKNQSSPLQALGDISKRLTQAGAVTLAMATAPVGALTLPEQEQPLRYATEQLAPQQPTPLQQPVNQVLQGLASETLPELVQRVRVELDLPDGLPAIGSAIPFDTRAPLAAAGAGAQAITIQGDTIHITIEGGSNSADTASLRRMLEQLLTERERAKAARLRSALYDQE